MVNPYQAPHASRVVPAFAVGMNWTVAATWLFLVLLNMIVPLLLGRELLGERGALGVLASIAAIMMVGLGFCMAWPDAVRPLLVGSGLIGLSQVFPVLQLFAGCIGLAAAKQWGCLSVQPDLDLAFPMIESELAGFVVGGVTGGILVCCALSMGLCLNGATRRVQGVRHNNSDR